MYLTVSKLPIYLSIYMDTKSRADFPKVTQTMCSTAKPRTETRLSKVFITTHSLINVIRIPNATLLCTPTELLDKLKFFLKIQPFVKK